jgi:membrane protein implicated in regulation of membrane protease activity
VRIEREEWRAESADGSGLDAGEPIRVVRVDGTRLVVERIPT